MVDQEESELTPSHIYNWIPSTSKSVNRQVIRTNSTTEYGEAAASERSGR